MTTYLKKPYLQFYEDEFTIIYRSTIINTKTYEKMHREGEVKTNPKDKQIYKTLKTHLQSFFFIYKLNKYPPFGYQPNPF